MKNLNFPIAPMLFTDYILPSGLSVRMHVLLPLLFLPVRKGVERREEKRREEIRPGCLPEKLKQAEARHDAIFCYCSCTQSDFTNSFFL